MIAAPFDLGKASSYTWQRIDLVQHFRALVGRIERLTKFVLSFSRLPLLRDNLSLRRLFMPFLKNYWPTPCVFLIIHLLSSLILWPFLGLMTFQSAFVGT